MSSLILCSGWSMSEDMADSSPSSVQALAAASRRPISKTPVSYTHLRAHETWRLI
ncbi:hypothetical protein [Ralstonia sp. ASV6]|uniref:hypothetical protein n=1 Tax=Ralstonia sp. ASV6 TaxID=2795124 RepID=UPI0018ECF042|nr:hypothetical protein [Ralstonia sp. ASV6]